MEQKAFHKNQKEFEIFIEEMEAQKNVFASRILDNILLSNYPDIGGRINFIKEEILKFKKNNRINDK